MHFTVLLESHVTRIRGRKSGNEIVLFCFLSEFIYNECNFGGIFSHRQVSRVHYTRRKVWQTLPFFSIILCVLWYFWNVEGDYFLRTLGVIRMESSWSMSTRIQRSLLIIYTKIVQIKWGVFVYTYFKETVPHIPSTKKRPQTTIVLFCWSTF